MKTCKDCIHYDVCQALEDGGEVYKVHPNQCYCFKDKSKFIELPCRMGDYIEWRNFWGNIVTLEVTGFEFDARGNAKKYHTKYADIQPPIGSEDVLTIIPQEEFDKQNGGLRRK